MSAMLNLWCLWESQVGFGAPGRIWLRDLWDFGIHGLWDEWKTGVCKGDPKAVAGLVGKKQGTECL